jgi:hypothetical protein
MIIYFLKRKNKMKKLILTLVALVAGTSAFANGVVFGPAKPPVKEGTGTFKAQSLGYEVRSVNDIKLVFVGDGRNSNGAVQKKLMDFNYQGVNFYSTATLSTNSDAKKAYAGTSFMVAAGKVVPGLSVDAGVTVRGITLDKGFRPDNSYYPTVALKLEPVTLVRHISSTPSRVEKTARHAVIKFVNDINHAL